MKSEIYPSKDGWRFRISGNNNEIMATGEAYVRRADAESALRQVVTAGRSLEVVVRNHSDEVTNHYVIGAVPLSLAETEDELAAAGWSPQGVDRPCPECDGDHDEPCPDRDDDTVCPDCASIGFHTSDCPSQEGADNAE